MTVLAVSAVVLFRLTVLTVPLIAAASAGTISGAFIPAEVSVAVAVKKLISVSVEQSFQSQYVAVLLDCNDIILDDLFLIEVLASKLLVLVNKVFVLFHVRDGIVHLTSTCLPETDADTCRQRPELIAELVLVTVSVEGTECVVASDLHIKRYMASHSVAAYDTVV